MTLTRPYSPISYVGNNEQKEFPFNFEEISTDLVKCFITRDDGTRYVPAFVINKEYDTGEEKEYRCVLELNTPLLDTEVITIYRETPQVQDTPFRTLQGYDARALENILSKIVAMIQEINDHNISMDITNGDWTFDVIKENLDKASLIIDFPAKKITTGLYFKVEDGYLYVSQDGEHYIKIADAEDVSDLTRRVEECEAIAGEANQKSEQAVNTANTALTTAEEARVKSQDAIDTSLTALNTANQANDKSDRAVADSAQAVNVANQANTKSDEAKSIAQEANTKSNQAVATANSADAKSDQAITTSQEALAGVQSAVEAAESATIAAQQATEAAEAATEAIATKQDKLTAGTGIEITENNVINNTQTSAEWGNITGTLTNQTDLQTALNAKQDALPDGTAGQILKKTATGVEWADESGGTITDVQVDGTSVVSGGVANVILTGKQDVLSTSDTVIVDGSTLNTNNIVWRKW